MIGSFASGGAVAIATRLLTAEESVELQSDETITELVRGEVVTLPPPGTRRGRLAVRIGRLLATLIEDTNLGSVVGGSGVIVSRNPDSVLAPDVAVYSGPPVPAIEETERYEVRLPSFVVEVVSPSDLAGDVLDKVALYLEAGVPIVIVVWPRTRELTVRALDGTTKTLRFDDRLDFGPEFPGLSLNIGEIFR